MGNYYVVCAELGIFGEKVGIFAGDLNRPDDDYGEVTDAAVHAAAEYLLHEKRDFYFSHNETGYIMRVVRDEPERKANLLFYSPNGITEVMTDQWIPCSERLPEIDVDVIVFYPYWDDKPIQIAHLNYDKLTFELSDGEFNFGVHSVTHWMPLPKQPMRSSSQSG